MTEPSENVVEVLGRLLKEHPGNLCVRQSLHNLHEALTHHQQIVRIKQEMNVSIQAMMRAYHYLDEFDNATIPPSTPQEATPEVVEAYPEGQPHRQG